MRACSAPDQVRRLIRPSLQVSRVDAVHRLWQDSRRGEAAARVPIEIATQTNPLRTADMIAERLRRYRDAGITMLQAKVSRPVQERIDTVAPLTDIGREVAAEPSVR